MKKETIIKKPFVLGVVLLLIIGAIVLFEKQKPVQEAAGGLDFVGIDRWINSEPLTMAQLKGKVVLVDFWTYTCINCIRTLPYLKEWDRKYRDQGLVIIGVHTPEFEFEKKYDNVLKAVQEQGIMYPVAQDNKYATWNAFQNHYWPHEFLIDIYGKIREDHVGEGGYEETEQTIQRLLKERTHKEMNTTITKPAGAGDREGEKIGTPEIYMGYALTRGNFGNKEGLQSEQTINYTIPKRVYANNVYLRGVWQNKDDHAELAGDKGSIILPYQAKNVNMVASADQGTNVRVFVNDKEQASVAIKDEKLYRLVNTEQYGQNILRLEIEGKGLKVYTFTFG